MTIHITTTNNRLVNGIVSLCQAFGVNDVVVEGKKKQPLAIDEDAEDVRIIAERANQPSRPFAEFAAELRQKLMSDEDAEDMRIIAERANEPRTSFTNFKTELQEQGLINV